VLFRSYDFAVVVRRIVSEAAQRYVTKTRPAKPAAEPPSVIPLTETQAAVG